MQFPLKEFFPPEIGTPRSGQLEVFEKLDATLMCPDLKYHLIDAPVGTGKSAIVASLTNYFEHKHINSVILTPLKYLQDQYEQIYPNIPNLKGRANYHCPFSDVTAAEAPCSYSYKKCAPVKAGELQCPYYAARDTALTSSTFVSNFRYFMLAKNMILGNNAQGTEALKRSVLIIDEAHTISDEVLSILGITLTSLMTGAPLQKFSSAQEYTPTLENALFHMGEMIDDITARLSRAGIMAKLAAGEDVYKLGLSSAAKDDLKNLRRFQEAESKLDDLIHSIKNGKEWVPCPVEDKDKYGKYILRGIKFVPLHTADFTHNILFKPFTKVFLLSGTFMQEQAFSKEIGIQNEQRLYTSIKHPFPVANRPITFLRAAPAINYQNQMSVLPTVAGILAQLMGNNYPEQRGIVFTVSGAFQQRLISELLRQAPGLESRIIDATPENKDQAVEMLANSSNGVIFTTSLWQGVDLKDDLSRFQVFAKTPYAPLGDPRIKKLANTDKTWYDIQTAKVMCQGYGRSIRTETDYADTWIIDGAFANFYQRAQHIFPPWFNEAVSFF